MLVKPEETDTRAFTLAELQEVSVMGQRWLAGSQPFPSLLTPARVLTTLSSVPPGKKPCSASILEIKIRGQGRGWKVRARPEAPAAWENNVGERQRGKCKKYCEILRKIEKSFSGSRVHFSGM